MLQFAAQSCSEAETTSRFDGFQFSRCAERFRTQENALRLRAASNIDDPAFAAKIFFQPLESGTLAPRWIFARGLLWTRFWTSLNLPKEDVHDADVRRNIESIVRADR